MSNPYLTQGDVLPENEVDSVYLREYLTKKLFTSDDRDFTVEVPVVPRDRKEEDTDSNKTSAEQTEDEFQNKKTATLEIDPLGKTLKTESSNTYDFNERRDPEDDQLPIRPPFVHPTLWPKSVQNMPSMMFDATAGLMPRMIVGSHQMFRNGLAESTSNRGILNWRMYKRHAEYVGLGEFDLEYSEIVSNKIDDYIEVDRSSGPRAYVKIKKQTFSAYEDDEYSLTMDFANRKVVKTGDNENDEENQSGKKDIDIALTSGSNNALQSFALTLAIHEVADSSRSQKKQSTNSNKASATADQWSITIRFGEVKVEYNDEFGVLVSIGEKEQQRVKLPAKPADKESVKADTPSYVTFVFIPVFNGLVVMTGLEEDLYSNDTASLENVKSTFCVKNKNLNLLNYKYRGDNDYDDVLPDYDGDYGEDEREELIFDINNPREVHLETREDSKINVGNKLYVNVKNCTISAGLRPVFFAVDSFAKYYFIGQHNNINTSYYYKLFPIWCANGSGAEILRKPAVPINPTAHDSGILSETKIQPFGFILGEDVVDTDETPVSGAERSAGEGNDTKETADDHGLFKNDSFINTYNAKKRFEDSVYSRIPPQIWGFYSIQYVLGHPVVRNGNGPYVAFPKNADSRLWLEFIKSFNVSYSKDGASGATMVDRYGMQHFLSGFQDTIYNQQIGQVCLDLETVAPIDALEDEDLESSYNIGTGPIFKGYGYGLSRADSPEANDYIVPIFGIEKKLQELKLINAPYFDGRPFVEVLEYLSSYGNFRINAQNAYVWAFITANSEVNAPRLDFKIGTSVWEALLLACEDTGHIAVPQGDGVVYIYAIDNVNGMPIIKFGHQDWSYPDSLITGADVSIDYSQFFNRLVLLAPKITKDAINSTLLTSNNPRNAVSIIPWMIDRQLYGDPQFANIVPQIPWEKLDIEALKTPVDSEEKLTKYMLDLVAQAKSVLLTGSLSIPANPNIKIFDTINDSYFVTSIAHTIDLQSKSATSQLQLEVIGGLNENRVIALGGQVPNNFRSDQLDYVTRTNQYREAILTQAIEYWEANNISYNSDTVEDALYDMEAGSAGGVIY